MKFLKNIMSNAMNGGIATVGGSVGRVITKKGAPMVPFLKDYPKFHGSLAYLIGAGVSDVKALHYAGIGMMAVAGTDTLGNFVPMLSATGVADELSDEVAEELADELAATLEQNIADEIRNDGKAMMNDDVGSPLESMNGI